MMEEAGAEIYRVEETAHHICRAYGMKSVDIYATTPNIVASVEVEDGVVMAHTRRIGRVSTDLEKVDRLNALARYMVAERPDMDYVRAELDRIKKTPNYRTSLNLLSYVLIASSFYYFFGGRSIIECIIAGVIGLLVGVLTNLFSSIKANHLLSKFFCSFVACMIAFASCRIGISERVDYIIIGNIMALIPGVGLTNSLRDLFIGDSVSGVLRFIESILLAVAIACGYIVTSFVFGGMV